MASASTDAAEIRRRGRQRLIGAIAIVLLLVVFVPMLLDSEPRKAADEPPLDIPSKDNAPPLPPPVPASAAPKMPEAPAATQDAVAPAKDAVAPAKDRPSPQPSPKAGGVSPPLEGFAVQVGAFRDEAKLKHARDKLAAAGVPHYTERLDTTSGGPLTRLRAGPFPTRQAADGAAAKLKAAQLPAQVVPLP
jgi:DedD protein